MRRSSAPVLVALVALLVAGVGTGQAAAGTKKLVEGTVYDTTCANVGECGSPCPPPCGGPVPAGTRAAYVCLQAEPQIVCPLAGPDRLVAGPDFCIQGLPCGTSYPVYSEEGAVVTLRKRGAPSFLAKLPVVEGRFRIRLSPGRYVIRPYLPEPQCWTGVPVSIEIISQLHSPVVATLEVANSCVARPETGR